MSLIDKCIFLKYLSRCLYQELLASSRIRADEDINDYAGKSEEQINEIIATKVLFYMLLLK